MTREVNSSKNLASFQPHKSILLWPLALLGCLLLAGGNSALAQDKQETDGLFVTVPGSEPVPMIRDEQLPVLIILFGVGWIALWLVFALMYWHALQKREVLQLNELEVFNTQVSVLENLAGVGVGLISILVAFFGSSPGSFSTSTWIYLLMFPLTWIIRKNGQKRKRALQNRLVEDMLDPSEPE